MCQVPSLNQPALQAPCLQPRTQLPQSQQVVKKYPCHDEATPITPVLFVCVGRNLNVRYKIQAYQGATTSRPRMCLHKTRSYLSQANPSNTRRLHRTQKCSSRALSHLPLKLYTLSECTPEGLQVVYLSLPLRLYSFCISVFPTLEVL